jgi:sarcosine oxidase, subunit beta
MKQRARVVVIGAGAVGLGVAYELMRRGETDVVVLDRQHLNFGATARNGGGVRAQWTTEANIHLAKESIRRFDVLSQELGQNLFWRRCGYLFVARREAQLTTLEESVAFQNRHGVETELLEPLGAKKVLPQLDVAGAGVLGAAYNPADATLFPWPLVWGYLEKCRAAGIEVHPFTTVKAIETEPGTNRVLAVVTDKGRIACEWVVNAAGSWANDVAGMVGLELPIRPERHEIQVTEPLKPFLTCMLVDLTTGMYANQSSRGEVVGGISEPEHKITMDWRSTLPFAVHMAKTLTLLLPPLKGVALLRQWAGSYDMTPDAKPIIEAHREAPGLITAAGFSGHGIMTSPVTVEIVADLIQGRTPRFDMYLMSSARFLPDAPPTPKEKMVIG